MTYTLWMKSPCSWRHFGDKETVLNSALYPVIYQKNGWPVIKQTSRNSYSFNFLNTLQHFCRSRPPWNWPTRPSGGSECLFAVLLVVGLKHPSGTAFCTSSGQLRISSCSVTHAIGRWQTAATCSRSMEVVRDVHV
jgi:hypothetical protein